MKVIATAKAITVGTAAAMADGFRWRIDSQFNLCPLDARDLAVPKAPTEMVPKPMWTV